MHGVSHVMIFHVIFAADHMWRHLCVVNFAKTRCAGALTQTNKNVFMFEMICPLFTRSENHAIRTQSQAINQMHIANAIICLQIESNRFRVHTRQSHFVLLCPDSSVCHIVFSSRPDPNEFALIFTECDLNFIVRN